MKVGPFNLQRRRDFNELAGVKKLWEIFQSEALPGRSGPRYTMNNYDKVYGGHVSGSVVDRALKSADMFQIAGEGLRGLFQPTRQKKINRDRNADLDVNAELDDKVTVPGRYSKAIGELEPVGAVGDLQRRAAQIAGVTTRDLMQQGPQSLFWLLNATEAIASLGSQAAQRGALSAREGIKLPFTNRRVLQQEAVTPAVLPKDTYKLQGAGVYSSIPLIGLTGLVSGTLLRAPGYKAVLPEDKDSDGDEYDTSKSQNLPGEIAMRILGRKGNLRAYSDLAVERPDVTKEEFLKYSAYLQGKSLIKATGEGIHGPEVNLFGKSIPLLTGIIPIAAGLIGARQGMRAAGNRLAGRGWRGLEQPGTLPTKRTIAGVEQAVPDRFVEAEAAYRRANKAQENGTVTDDGELLAPDSRKAAHRLQVEIEKDKLKGVLAGSTLLGGAAAVATQGLETVRQANNWSENRDEVAADLEQALKEHEQERARIKLDGLAGLVP